MWNLNEFISWPKIWHKQGFWYEETHFGLRFLKFSEWHELQCNVFRSKIIENTWKLVQNLNKSIFWLKIECLLKLPRILSKLPRLYQERFLDHLFVIPGTHAVNLSVSHHCRIVLHKRNTSTSYYFQCDVSGSNTVFLKLDLLKNENSLNSGHLPSIWSGVKT